MQVLPVWSAMQMRTGPGFEEAVEGSRSDSLGHSTDHRWTDEIGYTLAVCLLRGIPVCPGQSSSSP